MNEIYSIAKKVARIYSPSVILSLLSFYRSRLEGKRSEASQRLKAELLTRDVRFNATDLEIALKFARNQQNVVRLQKVIPFHKVVCGTIMLTLCYAFALSLGISQTTLTVLYGLTAVSFVVATSYAYRRSSVTITACHILEDLYKIHRLN